MKKPVLMIAGIAASVLLLIGAAFIGGQLIQQQQQTSNDVQAQPQMQVTPAAEVPHGDPTIDGFMDHREDNSLFLCGFPSSPTINEDKTVNKGGACSGLVKVVVTHETRFWHDISAEPRPIPTEGWRPEDWIMQQVVEPGDVIALTTQSGLPVWGEQNGNRVIAHPIVYWTARPAP
jgi:hypothetical protein